jgi:hypothetical protein
MFPMCITEDPGSSPESTAVVRRASRTFSSKSRPPPKFSLRPRALSCSCGNVDQACTSLGGSRTHHLITNTEAHESSSSIRAKTTHPYASSTPEPTYPRRLVITQPNVSRLMKRTMGRNSDQARSPMWCPILKARWCIPARMINLATPEIAKLLCRSAHQDLVVSTPGALHRPSVASRNNGESSVRTSTLSSGQERTEMTSVHMKRQASRTGIMTKESRLLFIPDSGQFESAKSTRSLGRRGDVSAHLLRSQACMTLLLF